MNYIPRQLEGKLGRYVKQFPVVVLTGARQSGKSTLLRHLFNGGRWQYLSLDQRGILGRINSDPDLFVKDILANIIIDEAQKAPGLFHSIKWRIDEGLKYKIILSGSANFQLLHKVTETLAGRAGVLELFPLSLGEKYRQKPFLEMLLSCQDINTLAKRIDGRKVISNEKILQHILWGGYPKVFGYKQKELKLNWFENYRTTYIERDLRDVAQVADLGDFQRFYQMLAFQTGGILNLSAIANELGISVPTCKKYLQILEASYQYFLLRPYHVNIHKRLVKSPKVYIGDTGLCNYFMGNTSLNELLSSGKMGGIFENSVISEIKKQNGLLVKRCDLYFWRTAHGSEVDLILEKEGKLIPAEIKSSINLSTSSFRGMLDFMRLKLPKRIPFGLVFYRGDKAFRLAEKILAVPAGCL